RLRPRQIASEKDEQEGRNEDDERPLQEARRSEGAKQVILLRAREQLLEIGQPDEAQGEAAGREREARQGQIGRDDEGKEGESEDDDDRRQHHHRPAIAVEPFGEAAGVGVLISGGAQGRSSSLFIIFPFSRLREKGAEGRMRVLDNSALSAGFE